MSATDDFGGEDGAVRIDDDDSHRTLGRRPFVGLLGAAALGVVAGSFGSPAAASHDGIDLRSVLTSGNGRWYQENFIPAPSFSLGGAGRTDAI